MCNVRGLCDSYWRTGAFITEVVVDGGWYDLQGTVLREHGVKSWVLREALTGREVLVRTPNPSCTLPLERAVRILGARRTIDSDNEDALIVSVSSVSEVLLVNA